MSLPPSGLAVGRSDFEPLTASPQSEADAPVGATPDAATCANCHAPSTSHFCGDCGAPRVEDRPLTVRRFAGDLWNEVTSLDSITTRTLAAFVRTPGRLTREYIEGRTRWYLSPLRLFLLMTALSLVMSSMIGMDDRLREETQRQLDVREARRAAARPVVPGTASPAAPAPAKRPLSARQRRGMQRLEALVKSMPEIMSTVESSQWLKLLNPLMMAAAMLLIYRRKRRNYAEHVVHAMHLLAFTALLAIVVLPVMMWDDRGLEFPSLSMALSLVILGRYFYLSTREVYRDSVRRSVADTALLLVSMEAAAMMSAAIGIFGLFLWRACRIIITLMAS